NKFCNNSDPFPIKKVRVVSPPKEKRTKRAYAKCKCGFLFNFTNCDEKDPKLPIVRSVIFYGPTWRAKVDQLLGQGKTKYAVAKELGIALPNIYSFLNSKNTEPKFNISPESKVTAEHRCAWLKIMAGTFNELDPAAAKRELFKLDRWLASNDNEWLTVQKKKMQIARPRKSKKGVLRKDWAQRDQIWSQQLREAAAELKQREPPVRVSKSALIRKTNMPLAWFYGAAAINLPLSQQVVRCLCDTPDDFRERWIRYYAKVQKSRGLAVRAWQVYHALNLKSFSLSSRIRAVLDEVCVADRQ